VGAATNDEPPRAVDIGHMVKAEAIGPLTAKGRVFFDASNTGFDLRTRGEAVCVVFVCTKKNRSARFCSDQVHRQTGAARGPGAHV